MVASRFKKPSTAAAAPTTTGSKEEGIDLLKLQMSTLKLDHHDHHQTPVPSPTQVGVGVGVGGDDAEQVPLHNLRIAQLKLLKQLKPHLQKEEEEEVEEEETSVTKKKSLLSRKDRLKCLRVKLKDLKQQQKSMTCLPHDDHMSNLLLLKLEAISAEAQAISAESQSIIAITRCVLVLDFLIRKRLTRSNKNHKDQAAMKE